ncbi:putative membrane protein YjdF [Methanomicrobium sp. W14]|uniref:DUF2238 domain-containing protein n=1 Tax=Methanomicrobium sp. W14 TaxID=2817839 RepID=UPI001AEB540D|nr:DUF2238 domain-containing protein [Methanomicrobium sp. W14]MBP2133435.1 putative membrane protein YjdF [Methanomicrobium sp. W14]
MKISIGVLIAYFLQLMILSIVISSLFTGYYFYVIGGVFALFLTLIPAIVERRINITIPWGVMLLIVLSLYVHLAGEYFGWYLDFYPYYDKIAHFISGSTVALLGFTAVLIMDRYTEMNFNRPMIIFMIIMMTMAFGAFWEIIEFTVDTFFGGNMQHGNTDTMLDMIFVLFGAVVVAAVGNFYMMKFPKRKVAEIFAGNLNLDEVEKCSAAVYDKKQDSETVVDTEKNT